MCTAAQELFPSLIYLDEKYTENNDKVKELEDIVYKAKHFEELIKDKEPDFVILYHDQDVWDPNISYIRTSCGDIISETDSELLIRTNNSEYLFLKGDFGLDESRKNTLILNVLTN